ncbi:hypothetical protein [Paenibacillus bouchesdurhonensis]|uniref:hypothetical protein n=1 Tax=Paenibacillus bouchesdurhonensis TaxID=1870990 RepID=UPI000DA62540|nr:hypothetical protein [Paenibacillus bouchesdurhonensis]
MRYYRLRMDERIKPRIEPVPLSSLPMKSGLQRMESLEEEAPLFLAVQIHSQSVFPDFLEYPVPLVSGGIRALLEKYTPGLEWRAAILTDLKQAKQEVYWVLRPPVEKCLSDRTEWYPDHTLKRLVLQYMKDMPPIFQIADVMEPYLFINLALAESLLRRPFIGIRLERVEIESKEGQA